MSHLPRVLRDDPLKFDAKQFTHDHAEKRPAHVAVMNNDLATLRDLHAAHGVDVLTTGLMQFAAFTPLGLAVALRRREAISLLIQLGVPVAEVFDITFMQGDKMVFGSLSALQLAAWRGDADMVAELLASNPDMNEVGSLSLCYYAAQSAETGVLKMLIARGFDAGPSQKFETAPMHAAAENRDESLLAVLLEARCDVSVRNRDGNSPLHLAARNENVKHIALLIAAGADVNARNVAGQTPCHFAAANPNVAAIAALIAHGADINVGNVRWRSTACDAACANPSSDVLAMLLEHGGRFGDLTVAYFNAAENPHPFAMQCVLKHNFDFTRTNIDGLTVLHVAARRSSGHVVQLLVAAGADMSARCTRYQRTPFHYAALNKTVDALRVLAASGADLYAFDKSLMTALHVAFANDNLATLNVFAEVGIDAIEAAKVDVSLVCCAASAPTGAVLQRLIRRGVDFRARSSDNGETPCFRASAYNLGQLFAAGANLDVSHSMGKSAGGMMAIYTRPILTLLAAGADVGADVIAGALKLQLSPAAEALLVAADRVQPNDVRPVAPNMLVSAIKQIAERQFELMRLRGFEIAVALQSLELSALVTCEILSFAFAPRESLIPFHRLWALATTVKHFQQRQHPPHVDQD